ncbi:transcriptional regulator, TetR family [Octadecabacter temperatus]|uniref:HTH-type transcriptional regulator MtrR n=1 Tax=Octadecabacter temperatus TaxID=1458307 RepID=A0A0K0Y4M4_9RHOB|nr:TetR/AcrR family transcriptional regulator [Octadecabacter temperatus]AKS45909.1 HTH-type transcriptional regulator MtrR [Octadecabacter temperatus]SIO03286.1 transcriptional regulator, TetR family [Octadecabacter temperatus]
MKTEEIAILDAALEVFMRYGFRRSTMSDVAKAAGLSRQSLYARFANKDEVYAAGVILYGERILEELKTAWAQATSMDQAMDNFANICIVPTFDLLRSSPDASDLIEAANSPEGQEAMARLKILKCAALSELFTPYAKALNTRGLTPEQLADFVETNKHTIAKTSQDHGQLEAQIATLKASVLSLTSQA